MDDSGVNKKIGESGMKNNLRGVNNIFIRPPDSLNFKLITVISNNTTTNNENPTNKKNTLHKATTQNL